MSPSSILACKFVGAGGIPWRLLRRTREMFYLGREKGFDRAGLLKRVQLYLSESHNHHQREGNKNNENPALHPISPAREAIRSERG